MKKKIEEIKDDPVYDELSLLTKMKDQSVLQSKEEGERHEVLTPAKVPKGMQNEQSEFV